MTACTIHKHAGGHCCLSGNLHCRVPETATVEQQLKPKGHIEEQGTSRTAYNNSHQQAPVSCVTDKSDEIKKRRMMRSVPAWSRNISRVNMSRKAKKDARSSGGQNKLSSLRPETKSKTYVKPEASETSCERAYTHTCVQMYACIKRYTRKNMCIHNYIHTCADMYISVFIPYVQLCIHVYKSK